MILEDDAYFFLQYPRGPSDVPGMAGLVPSYLSLDTDGRVIRWVSRWFGGRHYVVRGGCFAYNATVQMSSQQGPLCLNPLCQPKVAVL
jgi:hypothetical protein